MTKLFTAPALTSIALSSIALAATLIAVPATAKDHSWPIGNDQVHVYYRDLNMNTTAGRAAMLSRISAAATNLCKARMSLRVDVDSCVAQIVAQAAPRSPMLRLALVERDATRLAAH